MDRRLAWGVSAVLVLAVVGLLLEFFNSEPSQGPGAGNDAMRSAELDPLEGGAAAGSGGAADPADGAESAALADGEAEAELTADTAKDDRPISLQGVVRDENDEPIEGARLLLQNEKWQDVLRSLSQSSGPYEGFAILRERYGEFNDTAARTTSDVEGRYTFRALDPGDYIIVVVSEDHLPRRVEGVAIPLPAEELEQPVERDVELTSAEAITGRVLGPDGKGLPEVTIKARLTRENRVRGMGQMLQSLAALTEGRDFSGARTTTAEDGSFRVGGLEAELYDLIVSREDLEPKTVSEVPPGAKEVVISLSPGRLVTGRIVDPEGEPVEDAAILLRLPRLDFEKIRNPMLMGTIEFDLLGERERRVETEEDGRFSFEGLPSGAWELLVNASGFPPLKKRFGLSTADETKQLGDLAFDPAVEISGRVVDQGSPVAGIAVHAFPPGQSRRRRARGLVETVTDDGGRFVLGPLAAGPYNIIAQDDWLGQVEKDVEAPKSGLSLELLEGKISGRVSDAKDSRGIEGAQVSIDWGNRRIETDADGRFEFRGAAPEGGFMLQVEHPEYPRYDQWVQASRRDEILVQLDASQGLAGHVVDLDGEPVENAKVWISVPGMPELFARLEFGSSEVRSDAEGAFYLSGMPRWRSRGEELRSSHPRFGRARVKIGDQKQGFVIELGPGVGLEGSVRDTAGRPVPQARVLAQRKNPNADQPEMKLISSFFPPDGENSGRTNREGFYRLAQIEAGDYLLVVEALGYARTTLDVSIGEDPAVQDVTLEAGEPIFGRVVDVEGRPLEGAEVVAFADLDRQKIDDERGGFDQRMQVAVGRGFRLERTDGEGRFELRNLPDTRFLVVVRAKNYVLEQVSDVRPGRDLGDIVLEAYASLEVTVRARNTGQLVEEAQVEINIRNGPDVRPERVERGVHYFDQIEGGARTIEVRAPGYVARDQKVTLQNAELSEVEVLLDRGGTLRGIVTDSEGQALPGVAITAIDLKGDGVWDGGLQDRTDAEGGYEVVGLRSGRFRLQASHPGYYFAGQGQALEFESDGTSGLVLDLQLALAGRLTGRVTGERVPGKTYGIELRSRDGGENRNAGFSMEQQTYEVTSVPPGKYEIYLKLYRFDRETGTMLDETEERVGSVDIVAGETAERDLAPGS